MTPELKTDVISIIYEVLFNNKEFGEGEYVEVDYDSGDGEYKMALYVRDLSTLISLIKVGNGQSNFAIHYTTKKFPRNRVPTKRSSKSHAHRCKAIIIDFEPKKKRKLTEEEFQNIYEQVDTYLLKYPEIKNAVAIVGYTGGGGQLYIALSRWIEEGEVSLILDYLRSTLSDCPYIDPSTFNVSQGQRLLGTYSVKWGVQTDIVHDFRDQCKPLDVDIILQLVDYEEDLEVKRTSQLEEAANVIKNVKDAIKIIKERVKFSDLGFTGEYRGIYSRLHCPFHPPDDNPSFIVYHRGKDGEEIDIAADLHDDEVYDIISFYQKVYDKSFIDAIKDLAKKAGIKLVFDKEKVKESRIAQKLKDFDFDAYIREELCIVEMSVFKTAHGLNFAFKIEDRYGETHEVEADVKSIRRFSKAETFFFAHSYKIPQKVEQEIWDAILEYMVQKAKKPEEHKYDMNLQPYETEYLEAVIYNAEGTSDISDFFQNKATKYFAEDGKTYLNLSRLMYKISGTPALSGKGINYISKLLRRMGAYPFKLEHERKQKRVWILPDKDWRKSIDIAEVQEQIRIEDAQTSLMDEFEKKPDEEIKDDDDGIDEELIDF